MGSRNVRRLIKWCRQLPVRASQVDRHVCPAAEVGMQNEVIISCLKHFVARERSARAEDFSEKLMQERGVSVRKHMLRNRLTRQAGHGVPSRRLAVPDSV
jgi:hypothetical protein